MVPASLRSHLFAAVRFSVKPFSTLNINNLPQKVVDCEYAVRGDVLLKSEELEAKLSSGAKLPFVQLVPCNIGNPQAVGQSPLRFHRQVLACLAEPSLAQETSLFPEDVRERASRYLAGIKDGRMGAYSHSKGHAVFRHGVAEFLRERDGFETDPEDIFLTDGASPAVKAVLQLAVRGPADGVMLPIPQYPLYSASLTLLGGQAVGYYLDETAGWGIGLDELDRSIGEFRSKGGSPRAIAIINPGNPTGQVLSRENIAGILRFAERERLMVLADEVYQDNVYAEGKEFVSFRSVALEIGTTVEVFSFHSVSKGFVGECGLRGGFLHCHNVDASVKEQIYKLASICLCSNTMGQAMMASVLAPPPVGGPSRAAYDAERDAIAGSMRRKAKLLTSRLNDIEGVSCQPIEGAMYAFPSVEIKGHLLEKAEATGIAADQLYCLELVERTGIIAVPGGGFGQTPGTFHLRLTILPTEPVLGDMLDRFAIFHRGHATGWDA